MSNDLINALESRVGSAVETIETLRAENRELREDRQILENKLRELLDKIDVVEGVTASPEGVDSSNSNASMGNTGQQENATSGGFGFQRPVVGMDGNRSEY